VKFFGDEDGDGDEIMGKGWNGDNPRENGGDIIISPCHFLV